MKTREFNTTGNCNNKGQFMIANMELLKDFMKQWKNTKFTLSLKVSKSGTSSLLQGYYYNKIVPDIRNCRIESGEITFKEDTEKWMREICPLMWEECVDSETGEWHRELRSVHDIDNSEFIMYIDFIKQFAAEYYGFFIDDPKTYLNG